MCDFRLNYGRALSRKSKVIAVNRDYEQLTKVSLNLAMLCPHLVDNRVVHRTLHLNGERLLLWKVGFAFCVGSLGYTVEFLCLASMFQGMLEASLCCWLRRCLAISVLVNGRRCFGIETWRKRKRTGKTIIALSLLVCYMAVGMLFLSAAYLS